MNPIPWLIGFLFNVATAQEPTNRTDPAAAPSVDSARIQELAEDPTWLRLLHLRSTRAGFESRIVNQEFFLHPDGRTDPESELLATLNALNSSERGAELHCLYPARLRWLSQELDLDLDYEGRVSCPDLEAWTQSGEVETIHVVFVSGYLKSPASFFGHVLILLEDADGPADGRLLQTALNFGAVVPEDEGELAYVLKGLFGGYTSRYSNKELFFQNHIYGEVELRDLWTYELNLSSEKVDLLMDHIWELSRAEFRYTFLVDNCGFEMMELLQLVIEDLKPPDKFWFAPLDLFMALNDTSIPVAEVDHRPSRRTRFRARYQDLNRLERRALRAMLWDRSSRFEELDLESRAQVLEAALEYSELLKVKDPERARTVRFDALASRLQLPIRSDTELEPIPRAPHESQLTSMVQLAVLGQAERDLSGELRIRPAYRDMLSVGQDIYDAHTLTAFDIRLSVDSSGVSLKDFDLLEIESLGLSPSRLPGDRGMAWRLEVGAENAWIGCESCLVGGIRTGFGGGWALGNWGALYSLATMGALAPRREQGHVLVGTESGLVVLARFGISAHFRFRMDRFIDLPVTNWSTSIETRIGESQRHDLRIRWLADAHGTQGGIALGLYW